MAGDETALEQPVQVASVQTLQARAMRRGSISLPPADLIIVDECHHATATTWKKIIAAYPDAILVGLTATPCRGDGRGLGGIFQAIVEAPQVPDLVAQGFLVPTRVYAPAQPDLRGIEVRNGDWAENQLAERMDRDQLVGDIVTHWHRLAESRKTVVFATGVQHSIHIRDEFLKAGVRCAHIDGSTLKDDRDELLRQLGNGELDLITNCMVLTEGWDMPEVGCCVLARPTRKMGLYRQMIGRVLRPAPGKPDAIIIDHAGAVHRHGFAEDRVVWTLDPDRLADNPTHASRSENDISSRLVDCTQCGALRTGGEPCRHCGFMPVRKPQYQSFIDGDLAHVTQGGTKRHAYSLAERKEWYLQFLSIIAERNGNPARAYHLYREKFGNEKPPWAWRSETPIPASPEVRSYERSRRIAYAKAVARAA
jgi:superfamily II DNA or RNA helicase